MATAKARVLVVDDDPSRLVTLENVLIVGGYEVVTAQGGVSGLERLQARDFHLILSDLRMPDLSGLELLAETRERAPHVPVVIFTAYGTTATESAARQLGAVDFIDGLWDPDVLLKIVRQCIGKSCVSASEDSTPAAVGPAASRWVDVVVAAAQSRRDLATIKAWGEEVTKSIATLSRWCHLCGVPANNSLDFARALRVALRHHGHKCDWYNVLEIAEPKTMAVFLARAGFSLEAAVPDVRSFLQKQRFITKPELQHAILVAVAER
jgi:CheY-like chemotaxis protein